MIVTLSHICRAWRAIALAHPCFWTRVDGHCRERLETFAERSRGLPLSLFLSTDTIAIPHVVDILVSKGSRVHTLNFTFWNESSVEELGKFDIFKEMNLQCFTINYEFLCPIFHHETDFFLLGQRILPLTALSIAPITGRFPTNHFPNLTHLYLALGSVHGRATDTVLRLLSCSLYDLLHNTPKLEFLTFLYFGTGGYGFASDMSSKIQFPVPLDNLRSLTFIGGDLITIGVALERLSLPETALVRIHGAYVPHPRAPPLPRLNAVRSINRLSLATEYSSLQMVAEGPSSGLWLHSLIEEVYWSRNWSAWLAELPTVLPLAQVTHLDLYIGIHRHILPNLLEHMPGLEEFSIRLRHQDECLGGNPKLSIARAIYRLLRRKGPLLCPRLRVLSIDIDGARENTVPDLYLHELRSTMFYRKRIGRPIRSVRIQPFADEQWIDEGFPGDLGIAKRLRELKPFAKRVELLRPCEPVIQYDRARWGHWYVDGAEKYWNSELEEIQYVTPWERELERGEYVATWYN